MKKKKRVKKNKKIFKKGPKRRFRKKKQSKKSRAKRKKSVKVKPKKKLRKNKTKEFFRKIVRLSDNFRPRIKFNFDIDKKLQNFFQGIANKINDFKEVLEEERIKRKKERLKIIQKERSEEVKKNKIK